MLLLNDSTLYSVTCAKMSTNFQKVSRFKKEQYKKYTIHRQKSFISVIMFRRKVSPIKKYLCHTWLGCCLMFIRKIMKSKTIKMGIVDVLEI